MRDLLETLRKTLLDIGNFTLLLLLFMFVYILVGVQFFANHFHFDEDGKVIGIGEEGYYDAEVPRSNFDTLFHAFITVFEVSEIFSVRGGINNFPPILEQKHVAIAIFVAILKLASSGVILLCTPWLHNRMWEHRLHHVEVSTYDEP